MEIRIRGLLPASQMWLSLMKLQLDLRVLPNPQASGPALPCMEELKTNSQGGG